MVSDMDESQATLLRADDLARHCGYAASAPREQRFPPLEGGRTCDVAVVGGGLDLLTALSWRKAGRVRATTDGLQRNHAHASRFIRATDIDGRFFN